MMSVGTPVRPPMKAWAPIRATLLHGGEAAEDGVLADLAMAAERGAVDQDDMLADARSHGRHARRP